MNTEITLVSLAPCYLPSRRPVEVNIHKFQVPVSRFAPDDQALLHWIYETIRGIAQMGNSINPFSNNIIAAERHLLSEINSALEVAARHLGSATRLAGLADESIRHALHDIRGGGLTVLVGLAETMKVTPGNIDLIHACVEAARDHALMMRSMLPDLDPAAAQADGPDAAQGIWQILDKWEGVEVQGPGGTITVTVRNACGKMTSYHPAEAAAIDRVLYNYINNAVQFAGNSRVEMWVFPVRNGLVRWVVRNHLAEGQNNYLTGNLGCDFKRLFVEGVTTDGEGIGLANCAEIVAHCFGLDSPSQAVEEQYLGSTVVDGDYYAWFHWPSSTPHGCDHLSAY
ncbi:histidine kinase [Zavarzinella formosa]|uniref:HAMP domain-containing histidine kinase n=1 Tax=Zavarzinella formosa TaxID=360055 RepID=UPI00030815A7|nr:HAMP domain-containing histidine kinase [Zavarzinella formosa]